MKILHNQIRANFKVGRWAIKVVPAIEGYRKTGHADLDADSVVQFYDSKYAGVNGFPPEGQFVSSYYLRSTLLDKQWGSNPSHGLDLCGYEPEWKVSGEDYEKIYEILKALV